MILHVDLDAFFASIEQRDNPKLRGKPIAVGGPFPTRGVVATASYEARRFGIYSGMPLFKAVKLCPNLILVPGNFAKYEKASNEFQKICSDYSPIIEQISLDELYMDLVGTELLWESPRWVVEQIQVRVQKEIGITCSVGIAAQKTVAKIASGFKKPNGITEIIPGQEKEFLAPLPIKDLPGCGRKTQEILRYYDIKEIGEFAKIDPQHVRPLLGKHGLDLWYVASGMDDSKVTPPTDPKSTSRSTTFPFDTNERDFIENMMIYLIERVAKDLREAKTCGRCITVVVRTANFETSSAQYTVSSPINTSHEIFKTAKTLLYKLWDRNAKLRLVGVGVSNFIQMKEQFQLFERNNLSEKWSRVEKAADKVRNQHGFLSITHASTLKLKGVFPKDHRGFKLATQSLLR